LRIFRNVRSIKTVNAKYRIKNNITEPVSRFLKITKNSRAIISESRNFTDTATSVINTLFLASELVPSKKIKSEISAATVKHAVRTTASVQTKMAGLTLLSPSITSMIRRDWIKRKK
jgi:hypothetical protein